MRENKGVFYSFIVKIEEAGQRLDVFLSQKIKSLSRSQAKKIIKMKNVKLEGNFVLPKYILKSGQKVEVFIPAPKKIEIIPEEVPLEIIFEDEDLAVVNKPAGVVVHPGAGHESGTLVHGLLKRLKNLSGIGGELRPGIVHRLDKDTSGLLLVAKNDQAHVFLSQQFKARKIKKIYWALVHGVPKKAAGKVSFPIGRHPVHRKKMSIHAKKSREAITEWKILKSFSKAALLEVHPLTGRTHQIRVHLSSIGHPLVGDVLYGGLRPYIPRAPRHMLHAYSLEFFHPRTKERLHFIAPLPKDFKEFLCKIGG